MPRDLTITLIQSELHWEDPEANRKMFSSKIREIAHPTDIIILPEMFTTGFTMNAEEFAEAIDGPSMQWLHEVSSTAQSVVTGSLIIRDQNQTFNRLIWMQPDGAYQHYDKRHLFAMAGEHEEYTAGSERLIVELKGWRICPLICYDLRFPVWSRNDEAYDLLIYVANWPEKRTAHWNALLKARAIENQAYVAAVNRVGKDGGGYNYLGDSCLVDPMGDQIYYKSGVEDLATTTLSYDTLESIREKLPFLIDRDQFQIIKN